MAGLRITTWNVNGIRNPFSYQPWREKRSFEAMFDILEADIVVMQETKIQRKDLQDDMVLVPGWDVHFSLPKHKKGYSGVAIYTRNAVCAPIRAEEGITGVLTPPNSTTSFHDLPEEKQIGGYPSISQLSEYALDAATLDSEGRCVVLEFRAFVLIGVYCPANRDESRDEFRLGFLNALDIRVRNLVGSGKRVFLAGDLNIIREEIDTANADEQLRKHGMTGEEYVSTPARRLLNQLVVDGKVIGNRDEERAESVLVDLCRFFNPDRKGMFTCWETKINARPGNFGSRIDYVLSSKDWSNWFSSANIQEGLVGSDHCPVYAVLKEYVTVGEVEVNIKDIMNPLGMFKSGLRQRDWSSKDLLPTSARLIPEFDRRRSIRDMFQKKPSLLLASSTLDAADTSDGPTSTVASNISAAKSLHSSTNLSETPSSSSLSQIPIAKLPSPRKESNKRVSSLPSATRPFKRSRSSATSAAKGQPVKGQSSLVGFFKPKAPGIGASNISTSEPNNAIYDVEPPGKPSIRDNIQDQPQASVSTDPISSGVFSPDDQESVIDPIVSKESWSKLLGKRVVPRCDHNEPCVSFKTKKPGENCGRYFYMCARPLGPSGQKEKNTQWRCGTFIWSSDWTSSE
ncbi:DNA-(apurinic or apyrimidinic site) lyase 2 [Phlyctema vagabunda]|uniref:DNA-(apurinic or apyrimidinic site) endonuclease 2 n=1 Tax=Phlyctema vagabunda TaxID=108571 RepID=A0ABR4PA36_9HELO